MYESKLKLFLAVCCPAFTDLVMYVYLTWEWVGVGNTVAFSCSEICLSSVCANYLININCTVL